MQTLPHRSITDPKFKYRSADHTDIRRTLRKARLWNYLFGRKK